MTQTFQEYLDQHDGSNGFQNRRRERALAQARRQSAALVAKAVAGPQAPVLPADDWDAEYQAWKREMGLDAPLTDDQERQAYNAMFNPCGIY